MKKMLAFFSWVPGKVAAGRKGGIQTQRLSRLAVSTSTMTLRRKENVETLPATSQKIRSPWLSRLASTRKTSIYPAWRLPTNPAFIPLGGHPQTQCLSRLAATHKPSIYPAWRPLTNPVFIPLGACPQTQRLSRLAAARKPSVYPAWRLPANPVFIPLGEPCIYAVWLHPRRTQRLFIPLGSPLSLFRIRRGSRWRCRRFCRPRRRSLPR